MDPENHIKELFSDLSGDEVDQILGQAIEEASGAPAPESPPKTTPTGTKNLGFSSLHRPKTSLRMHYEAEVAVLKKTLGDLEQIREKLGLSRRKMAQLLMVDPSAWTRWCRDDRKVPPHIYRALQWYLELVERSPEYHPKNSFKPAAFTDQNAKLQELNKKVDDKMKRLEFEMQRRLYGTSQSSGSAGNDRYLNLWKILLLANTGLWLALLAYMLLK
ncbi:MAG: hypothetical protein KDD59_04520 [Bdellovibrionales bacterium]|nr:hypothetical protein [Bdellovibrionales bacterium]